MWVLPNRTGSKAHRSMSLPFVPWVLKNAHSVMISVGARDVERLDPGPTGGIEFGRLFRIAMFLQAGDHKLEDGLVLEEACRWSPVEHDDAELVGFVGAAGEGVTDHETSLLAPSSLMPEDTLELLRAINYRRQNRGPETTTAGSRRSFYSLRSRCGGSNTQGLKKDASSFRSLMAFACFLRTATKSLIESSFTRCSAG